MELRIKMQKEIEKILDLYHASEEVQKAILEKIDDILYEEQKR